MDATTQAGTGTRPVLTVEQQRTLAPEVGAELRRIYLEAFEPMKARSFTRIVMTDAEWDGFVVHNEHTLKHVGRVDGVVAGVLLSTDRPDLVDWVSIDFLRARYPEALAAGKLFYILSVAVDPALARTGIFRRLLDDFIIDTDWQVAVYDTCQVNGFVHDTITQSAEAAGIVRPPNEPPLDVESFYGWTNVRA
jgi:GNAT superfamily N-acetyltransferase